jgi:hypothetical protein
MSRLVVFVESHRPMEERVASVEHYLDSLAETVGPFLRGMERTWNAHRDRVTLRTQHLSAEVVFLRRGILVLAEVPPYLHPFRGRIEERIRGAVAAIAGNGRPETVRPEAT